MILNISQSKKMTKEKRYNKERGGNIRGMDIKGNERAGKKWEGRMTGKSKGECKWNWLHILLINHTYSHIYNMTSKKVKVKAKQYSTLQCSTVQDNAIDESTVHTITEEKKR